jgi:hypothetical protein
MSRPVLAQPLASRPRDGFFAPSDHSRDAHFFAHVLKIVENRRNLRVISGPGGKDFSGKLSRELLLESLLTLLIFMLQFSWFY